MATTRGFVDRIEAGRAGLITIRLVTDSGRSSFVITDIDGDPERFNERLTKVALARDAMNKAEPVEIESAGGKAGAEIERIARLSRDDLDPPAEVTMVSGLVIKLVVQAQNAVQNEGEAHDEAKVFVLQSTGVIDALRLDLQIPERGVAEQQLELIRDAHAAGDTANFLVSSVKDAQQPSIIAVWTGQDSDGSADDGVVEASGFVESLGVILPPGAGALTGSLALTRITTAPEFTGIGGTVDLTPFAPEDLGLFLARGSVPYALIEAGLRDSVRVRVRYQRIQAQGRADVAAAPVDAMPTPDDPGAYAEAAPAALPNDGVRFRTADSAAALLSSYGSKVEPGDAATGVGMKDARPGLLLSVELLAPLSSASRPVWLHIDREMLDEGPECVDECTPGLPTSSLRTRTLRDLRIPYRAEWKGRGCFNHGVYRFELTAPSGSTMLVDCEQICLYDSGVEGVVIGYSCLEGDHLVTVEIPEYVCNTEFDLDAYRIR